MGKSSRLSRRMLRPLRLWKGDIRAGAGGAVDEGRRLMMMMMMIVRLSCAGKGLFPGVR